MELFVTFLYRQWSVVNSQYVIDNYVTLNDGR